MIFQVVVLAGGLGARLGEHSQGLAKPIVDFGGKPFLELLLDELKRNGVSKVTLAVGHKAETVIAKLSNPTSGVEIDFSIETKPLGTGGALLHAFKQDTDCVVVVNGDTYQRLDLRDYLLAFNDPKVVAGVGVRDIRSTNDFGALELDEHGNVSQWSEKTSDLPGFAFNGVAAIRSNFLSEMKTKYSALQPCSLERDIVPTMLKSGSVRAIVSQHDFFDIGTPERLATAREKLLGKNA